MKYYKPLQVKLMSVRGIPESMKAMRLPKRTVSDTVGDVLGPEDAALAARLIRAGDDHAKAVRGVVAYIEMDMQVGWMIEFETYRCGIECLSTSSAMHGELRDLSGPELAEQKQADLPGKVYTRIVTVSYQALRAIYRARRMHRHPDWKLFCTFIEGLPYFAELIYPEKNQQSLRMHREAESVLVCKDCGRPMHRFHNCEINPTKDGDDR